MTRQQTRLTPGQLTGVKQEALLQPLHESGRIHISKSQPGETYYHPVTLEPMHARREHPTPHFYMKSDNIPRYQGREYSRNKDGDGLVHQRVQLALTRLKKVHLLVNDVSHEIRFSSVIPEYHVTKTSSPIRIDLVCAIASPEHIKERFGGGINIEICCHHPIDDQRRELMRQLPWAAAQITISRKMLKEIEEQNQLIHGSGGEGYEAISESWDKRIYGLLNKVKFEGLFYIPGEEDPRLMDNNSLHNLAMPSRPKRGRGRGRGKGMSR